MRRDWADTLGWLAGFAFALSGFALGHLAHRDGAILIVLAFVASGAALVWLLRRILLSAYDNCEGEDASEMRSRLREARESLVTIAVITGFTLVAGYGVAGNGF